MTLRLSYVLEELRQNRGYERIGGWNEDRVRLEIGLISCGVNLYKYYKKTGIKLHKKSYKLIYGTTKDIHRDLIMMHIFIYKLPKIVLKAKKAWESFGMRFPQLFNSCFLTSPLNLLTFHHTYRPLPTACTLKCLIFYSI